LIPIRKLRTLPDSSRIRKYSRLLYQLEAGLRGEAAGDAAYLRELAALVSDDDACSQEVRMAAGDPGFLSGNTGLMLRCCNTLRHLLLAQNGDAPADWDLFAPVSLTGQDKPASGASPLRTVFPVDLYLDDLRSPFNIGSIFRIADSFGVREIILSEHSADPLHRRSFRSSMGCVERIPWRRSATGDFSGRSVVALETGGTPLEEFVFPDSALLVIGSEELGVSPEKLDLAERSGGTVSILTGGLKGSINVAVAAGIVLHEWFRVLTKRSGRPEEGSGRHR
jgi:TrmH family RNA methyltransferase